MRVSRQWPKMMLMVTTSEKKTVLTALGMRSPTHVVRSSMESSVEMLKPMLNQLRNDSS